MRYVRVYATIIPNGLSELLQPRQLSSGSIRRIDGCSLTVAPQNSHRFTGSFYVGIGKDILDLHSGLPS